MARKSGLKAMESITSYSHYLAMKGQLIGLATIDGHQPAVEEKEVQSEICRACDKMAMALPTCAANEIADLTGYYSMLHTIGYHQLPNPSLMEKQRERLVGYWKSGDRSVEESDVYWVLQDSMRNLMSTKSSASQQVFNNLREGWITTLKRFNSFPETNAYERYKRLALIMRDNIDPYFNGNSTVAKKSWFEKNRIADLTTVGTKILTAYRLFVCSLFPAVLSYTKMSKLDIIVLKELIGRSDLNDYDRKAYQLALQLASR